METSEETSEEKSVSPSGLDTLGSGSIDMTVGKPYKNIWRFAFPLIIGNLLQQMYNMVDSLVIGRSNNGDAGLAALGASGSLIFLFNAFFIGFSVGTTIVIAQFIGKKQQDQVQKTVDTIYRTLFLLSIPMSVLAFLLARPLLELLNTPPAALDYAVTYTRISFAGLFTIYGFNINSGIMQGLGDSKSPLLFLAIGMIVNIVLDILFVFYFGWGVAGAAIATVIAQFIAFVFSTIYINRKQQIKIHVFKNTFDKDIMKSIFHLGLPAGLQNMLFTMGFLFLQSLIGKQGEDFLAGYGVGNKIDQMALMIESSFASALTAFAGQNYGAKKYDRLRLGLKQTMLMAGLITVGISAVIMLFSKQIISVFNTKPEIVSAGQSFIYGVMPFYILLNALFLLNSALRGMNRSIVPMIGAIFSIIVRVLTAYWLTARFGKEYMFISYGLGWLFSLMVNGGVYIFVWRGKEFKTVI